MVIFTATTVWQGKQAVVHQEGQIWGPNGLSNDDSTRKNMFDVELIIVVGLSYSTVQPLAKLGRLIERDTSREYECS